MLGVEVDGESRRRRERWWRSAFLVVATTYLTLSLLALLARAFAGFAQIFLILFLAWLLAFVLSPLVDWVAERRAIPHGLAVGLVYVAALLLSAFVLFYAVSATTDSVATWTADFPLTRARIEGTLHEWQDFIAFGRFNPDLIGLYRDVEDTVTRIGREVIGEVPSVTVTVIGALVLVIVLSLYMVADRDRILERLARVVPGRYRDEYRILERSVATAFGAFLRAQVLLAGVQAVLVIVVVVAAGLPYGFLVVASSALLMLVPFFGPPLALLPPIVVLVGLLVGSQIAGVWGALFGIPVLAVLNVFFNYAVNLRNIEETPEVDTSEMLEQVRHEMPDATHEELVALAAERLEGQDQTADA